MVYGPTSRRAAGLGRGTFAPDPDRYETRPDFADLLVIGGGPAGLAAAIAAGRAGARVALAEQDALLGGSLLAEPLGGPAARWLRDPPAGLQAPPHLRGVTPTPAIGVYDRNMGGPGERPRPP